MVPSNKYRPEKTQRHQGENAETDPQEEEARGKFLQWKLCMCIWYMYIDGERAREREKYIYIDIYI